MKDDDLGMTIATTLGLIARVVVGLYLAFALLNCARGLTVAALNYSVAQRFAVVGYRGSERALVFDTATGEITTRPVPEE